MRVLLLLGSLVAAACTLFEPPVPAPPGVRVDCATAAVIGLHWSPQSHVTAYRVVRDGQPLGIATEGSFTDIGVAPATTYRYEIAALDREGRSAATTLTVTTAAAGPHGDAPYCPSSLIAGMVWDWRHAYRAAIGSDLWPATWGRDGNVYAFFGDGGGFGGDDNRGRASFGIAQLIGPPPPAGAAINLYGGYQARYPSELSGKARALLALGQDFYAIAGIYRPGDAKWHDTPPIAGSPPHVEIVYSRRNAHSWQDSGWTFCESDGAGPFCPAGFVNSGPGYEGAPDRYVYLLGTSATADRRLEDAQPGTHTYLARVPRRRILKRQGYEYFSGWDLRGKPSWSTDPDRMQPVFTDRNAPQAGCGGGCSMSSTLEEAIYDTGLGRYIGVAQGDYLAQTSFYEAPHPWGPWRTLSYDNIDAATGRGGWGKLGTTAGESLGVHPINAWTSADGRSLWMTYSSDGVAPPEALFPSPGSKLDALHLVNVQLQLAPP